AAPLSGGTAPKNFRNASRPPADAPIPTTGMDASRPRPTDATRAARHTFGTEGRALRCRGAIFVARFRPRPICFIWSRPAVAYRWELSWRAATGRGPSGGLRRTTYRGPRAHESGFRVGSPRCYETCMADDGEAGVHWFASRSGHPMRPAESVAVAVLEDAVGILMRYVAADDRSGRTAFAEVD